jgi:hypothetical protein
MKGVIGRWAKIAFGAALYVWTFVVINGLGLGSAMGNGPLVTIWFVVTMIIAPWALFANLALSRSPGLARTGLTVAAIAGSILVGAAASMVFA